MPISAVALTGDSIRLTESLCKPPAPVPTIRFHGKADRYMPFDGGQGCLLGKFFGVAEIEEKWRERNSCDGARKQYSRRGPHVCHTWSCEASFVSCHLEGGHDWPTAAPRIAVPSCDGPAPDYPFANEIWKFFTRDGRDLEAPR